MACIPVRTTIRTWDLGRIARGEMDTFKARQRFRGEDAVVILEVVEV